MLFSGRKISIPAVSLLLCTSNYYQLLLRLHHHVDSSLSPLSFNALLSMIPPPSKRVAVRVWTLANSYRMFFLSSLPSFSTPNLIPVQASLPQYAIAASVLNSRNLDY